MSDEITDRPDWIRRNSIDTVQRLMEEKLAALRARQREYLSHIIHQIAPLPKLPTDFLTTPILAWRWWYVADGALRSIHQNPDPWMPCEIKVAMCLKEYQHTRRPKMQDLEWALPLHDPDAMTKTIEIESTAPPDRTCECGIYALKNLDDAKKYYDGLSRTPRFFRTPTGLVENAFPAHPIITGRLALWGKVIEHERGYRAQYAYPESFIAFDDDCQVASTIATAFKVPLVLMPREVDPSFLPKSLIDTTSTMPTVQPTVAYRTVFVDGKPIVQSSSNGVHWRDE